MIRLAHELGGLRRGFSVRVLRLGDGEREVMLVPRDGRNFTITLRNAHNEREISTRPTFAINGAGTLSTALRERVMSFFRDLRPVNHLRVVKETA